MEKKKEGRGWLRTQADRALARVSPPVLGLLIVLIGGGLSLAAWSWSKHGGSAQEVIGVEVRRGDIEDLVAATGTLQPRDYVDVGAQVSGQLEKIHVEVGQSVKEGELLAEIDAEQSAARVEASLAQMRSLEAQLEQRRLSLVKAERDLARYRNLVAEEAATLESLQNAETEAANMRAQMAQLRAQIDQLRASTRVEEANLKYTRIYAPMAGTVVSIAAKKGQTLNTNQQAPTLMRIADLAVMNVQTQVSEADVSKLRSGMAAYFTTLGGQGRRWYGKLDKIEPTPTVTNNVVLYNALFEVPNESGTLMTQMTAQVFFVVAQVHDVLLVPMSALNQSASGPRRQNAAGPEAQRGAAGEAAAVRPVAGAQVEGEARGARRRAQGGEDARMPGEARGARRDAAAGEAAGEAPGMRRGQGGEDERGRRQQDGEARSPRRDAAGEAAAPRNGAAGEASAMRRGQSGEGGQERRRPDGEARNVRRDAAGDAAAVRPVSAQAQDEGSEARRRTAGERNGSAAASLAGGAGASSEARQREARVKVILPDGSIEERQVTVGVSNRIHAEVISGLAQGERVVAGVREQEKARSESSSNNRQPQSQIPGMPGGAPVGVPRGR